jgi:hypothetical protein
MIELPLVTDHNDFAQTAAEMTINWYAEKVSDNFVLRCTPGLSLFGAVSGAGGIRGLLSVVAPVNRLFAVRGNGFFEWDGAAFVLRGNLSTSSGIVGMAYNDTQVIVVDENKGYGYTVSNTSSFAEISPFQGGASQVAFTQLRMVTIEPGTDRWWVSNQDDVFTWNPLAGARAESLPDPLVALASVGQALYLFGSNGYEVWTTTPNFNFPFARTNFVGQNIGCAAKSSVSVFGNSVYFLGGNAEGRGIVYVLSGYQPVRISDNRIEEIIQGLPSFDDAVGFTYQEQGHVFYVLSFGIGDKTLVYDVTTKIWAQREYRNPVSGVESRRPEIVQCVFNGKMLVGDFRSGNIYEMSRAYQTDDGNPVIRTKVLSVWPTEQIQRVHVPPFALFLDMGKTASGVEAPQAMLSFSDNRGETYGIEHYRELGRTGEYGKRVVWHGQGTTYGRNYKIRLTGDQDFVLRKAGLLTELV